MMCVCECTHTSETEPDTKGQAVLVAPFLLFLQIIISTYRKYIFLFRLTTVKKILWEIQSDSIWSSLFKGSDFTVQHY